MMLQAQHREIVDRVMCPIFVNVVNLNGQSRRVAYTTAPVMLEHDLRRNVVRDWRSRFAHSCPSYSSHPAAGATFA
jgi:hypothetical protein